MPPSRHVERHFEASDSVRDIVIGMSDGLTVPFALAAGLSGVVAGTQVVITAGGAEIAAGAIAMGLGGYLAARTDRDHYKSERAREVQETKTVPQLEREEVAGIFRGFGLDDVEMKPLLDKLSANPTKWVDFMMKFELGLEKPEPGRAVKSALTIAASYIAGGLIPLWPYLVFSPVERALAVSAGVTLLALFVFGSIKGRFTGVSWLKSGLQTLVIGGLAAGAAFGLARLLR
jgi:VIT1/CCC1 family predicted Fe2+/Mn2+ transporter